MCLRCLCISVLIVRVFAFREYNELLALLYSWDTKGKSVVRTLECLQLGCSTPSPPVCLYLIGSILRTCCSYLLPTSLFGIRKREIVSWKRLVEVGGSETCWLLAIMIEKERWETNCSVLEMD